MHELVMAQQIVRSVRGEVERVRATEVRSIDVDLGDLEALDEDDLREAFRLEASGTPLEDAVVNVTRVAPIALCPSCNTPKPFDLPTSSDAVLRVSCPDCGADLDFKGGRGLVVRRATIVLEDP